MSNKIENPFPQMGTPSSYRIKPVGYTKKIEKMLRSIDINIGTKPLFYQIVGEYGQAKTTMLLFLQNYVEKNFHLKTYNYDLCNPGEFENLIQKTFIDYQNIKEHAPLDVSFHELEIA